MEGLDNDLERLARTNELVAQSEAGALRVGLRRIDALVLYPQADLAAAAATHARELPRSVRVLLRTMGASSERSLATFTAPMRTHKSPAFMLAESYGETLLVAPGELAESVCE